MYKRYKMCICGGGNIGHALAAMLGSRQDLDIRILTGAPQKWKHNIEAKVEEATRLVTLQNIITDDPLVSVKDADIIFITVPSHARAEILRKISPYVKENAWVGGVPGSGGFEWIAKTLLGDKVNIFGLQRVPYISRIIDYGKSVNITSVKKEIYVATLYKNKSNEIKEMLNCIFQVPVHLLDSYLEVTLSTSNPILHPSRLYGMFSNWKNGQYYKSKVLFYEQWDDFSSKILLSCDEELQQICKAIPIRLSGVKSLKEHYESQNEEELSQKIKSIKAFKGIETEMIYTREGYMPDFQSRYFLEDIPFGLVMLRGIGEITKVKTPTMDLIIQWAQLHMDKQFIDNGKLNGKDMSNTSAPQMFNINSLENLVDFYCG
jgi:opine dehydrogenase